MSQHGPSGVVTQPDNRSGRGRGRGNLVEMVGVQLRRAILDGEMRVGDKLPSEAELTRQYDVSRTVIREAIASLRADGLVEARHGVGVFVQSTGGRGASPLQDFDPARISSIIEVLELRTAVEVEAAGLAALRRSPAQEEAIWEHLAAVGAAIDAGRPTIEADFAFHVSIAEAANNPRFRDFLMLFGPNVIPRAGLQSGMAEAAPPEYLRQIQSEHRRIADAISARDEEGARQAMRVHLKGGQQRYRNLIRRADV